MAWRVADPRSAQELMLVLPRTQPASAEAAARWEQAVRQGARLGHPNLAPVLEIGQHEGWPFAAYDPNQMQTLRERVGDKALPPVEAAALMVQVLQGLAFAHDGGVAHLDLQPYLVLVGENGALRIAGLEVAGDALAATAPRGESAVEPGVLAAQRDAAQVDISAVGLLLHYALIGQPALDEPDVGRVLQRMPPLGRDIVRLPWDTPQPLPEALRVIVNRATDRQERQRYRNARTLALALEGWLQTDEANGGGPLALLLDRLHHAGVLPSSPGVAERAARLTRMDRQSMQELADVVLQDLALSFELLRAVNTAQVRGAQVSGSGPVLTVRRAIAMIGLDGVRHAATALRPWPGPLSEAGAADLERLIERVKRAGRAALLLRPAGYDAEVVYLITLLQNLGRLVVQYHFPDESTQIRRLMQPAPAQKLGEPEEPGMTEAGASVAVLGVDIEAIGTAVARHWGLDDSVLHLIRRLPLSTAVRSLDSDDDVLRAVASCANEVMDASTLSAIHVTPALQRVAQRYARVLNLSLRDLQDALLPPTGGLSAAISSSSAYMDLDPLPAATAEAPARSRSATRAGS